MPLIHKDSKSTNRLVFPSQNDEDGNIALSERFLAYEQTLPPESQAPYNDKISGWYQKLLVAKQERTAAQSRRSIASQKIKQAEEDSKELLRQMWKTVTLHCYDVISEVTQWGFKMKQTTGNALMPQTRDERLATMTAYINKEQSRPEEERFAKPDLAEIITTRDALKAHVIAYQIADTQQRNYDEQCETLLESLSDYLQASAIDILARNFKMKLSTQLQNWGYEVSLKRRGKSSKSDETASINGTTTESSTNGSTNGSTNVAASAGGQTSANDNDGLMSTFTD
ncbi:MAG: hypothetical protein KDJ65_30510 [Anaerolineae bacterium]|nr:hypothetical protein [Anaerolineae bacterium]